MKKQPKKAVIEAAKKDGTLLAADTLLSAAHLLSEIAAYFVEEADSRINERGLALGDVKFAQGQFRRTLKEYDAFWGELIRISGCQRTRTADFDRFMPIIARLLQIGHLVTDTNTGKPVCSGGGTEAAQAPSANGSGGAPAAVQESSDDPADRAIRSFRVMRMNEYEPPVYRAALLTPEQLQALGGYTRTTVRTHERVMQLLHAYADGAGCKLLDIMNEAFLQYIDSHPSALTGAAAPPQP